MMGTSRRPRPPAVSCQTTTHPFHLYPVLACLSFRGKRADLPSNQRTNHVWDNVAPLPQLRSCRVGNHERKQHLVRHVRHVTPRIPLHVLVCKAGERVPGECIGRCNTHDQKGNYHPKRRCKEVGKARRHVNHRLECLFQRVERQTRCHLEDGRDQTWAIHVPVGGTHAIVQNPARRLECLDNDVDARIIDTAEEKLSHLLRRNGLTRPLG